MLEYRTSGFNGYSVQYSPFFDSRLAVPSAANFGLVGNGRLYILNLTPNGVVAEKWYDTQDSLFDLAWSESHENQIIAATGDGSLKLFDIGLNDGNSPAGNNGGYPIASWQEHKREVFSVHWNQVSKDTFCSSSWDGTVKVWSPDRPTSLLTLPTHTCTYSALFSPHSPSILSAVSSDSHLRVFDLRTPASASNHLVMRIPIHAAPAAKTSFSPGAAPPSEALSHDWNRYNPSIVATGSVDRMIRTFDTRAPAQGPLAVLGGHEYAVRRLAWSPHLGDILLSASYDMTARIWRTSSGVESTGVVGPGPGLNGPGAGVEGPGGQEIGRMNQHSEFVTGVDWCLFGAEGWCASVGWDERVLVWDVRAFMGR